jgi:lipoprotein-releasing system permease protein
VRYEYLIGIRYLRARRRERFVSLIAVISLAGVAIGTFALTVVISVMTGFQEDLRARLLAYNPQISIEQPNASEAALRELADRIGQIHGVTGVAPFIRSQVLTVSTTESGLPAYVSGGTLRGVIPTDNPVLTELRSTLTGGSLAGLATTHPVTIVDQGQRRLVELPGAIIGKSLANQLDIRIGDPIIVISPASLAAGAGTPRLRRFVIAGFFSSGMYEFDSTLIFTSLRDGRALLANDPQLETGVEVRLNNLFDAPTIARKIAATMGPGFTVTDWTQTDAPLFSALKLETFTYFVVLLLIVLVAAFNIVATLVMVVMERRKEIAILRAMGARAASIALIFLCEGAALGVGGTIAGVSLGFATSFLIGRYHLIHLPPDLFMVSAVPVRLYAVNFIAIAAAAILLCLCAAIYPALQARSLRPVEIIRYE